MSMPALKKIERLSFHPAEWRLTTIKDKKIFVLFLAGELKCRQDSPSIGKLVFTKTIKRHSGLMSMMTTNEMLAYTQYKMNNDWQLAGQSNIEGEKPGTNSDPQPQTPTISHSVS